GQLADVFGFHDAFDHHLGPRAQQDLPGLGLAAQARREDGDVSDGPVVLPAFETDASKGRVPDSDADPKAKLVSAVMPEPRELDAPIAHRHRHANPPPDVTLP